MLTSADRTGQDWAAGPSRAVGLGAAGPLGRRGPWAAGRWAAGLLLANPTNTKQQLT